MIKNILAKKYWLLNLTVIPVLWSALVFTPAIAFAGTKCGGDTNGNQSVTTAIDIGCQNKGNPIMDMLFAVIRVLSDGVGLVIVASFIWGGIQYSSSRGEPQNSAKAIARIQTTLIALLIYIFGYAFLNYILPGAVLQ